MKKHNVRKTLIKIFDTIVELLSPMKDNKLQLKQYILNVKNLRINSCLDSINNYSCLYIKKGYDNVPARTKFEIYNLYGMKPHNWIEAKFFGSKIERKRQ